MDTSDWITLCFSIINVLAIIIIPIVAVVVGQKLQTCAKKREDKIQIFKILMTSRIYDWTTDEVHALNILDIVFSDDKEVRDSWKDLYDKLCVSNPSEVELEKIQTAKYKLLETIAKSLGYENQIIWETIQNPYIPKGLLNQLQAQATNQNNLSSILGMMVSAHTSKETGDLQKNTEIVKNSMESKHDQGNN